METIFDKSMEISKKDYSYFPVRKPVKAYWDRKTAAILKRWSRFFKLTTVILAMGIVTAHATFV